MPKRRARQQYLQILSHWDYYLGHTGPLGVLSIFYRGPSLLYLLNRYKIFSLPFGLALHVLAMTISRQHFVDLAYHLQQNRVITKIS